MTTALDKIFEEFSIVDKGIKCFFKIEGEEFWIVKTTGLFRLQTIARSLIDVCELNRTAVISGVYDHLISALLQHTFVKTDDQPDGVCLSDYEDVMGQIHKKNPMAAVNIHQDLPYGMAIACLGKSLLGEMIPTLVTSTSANSKDQSDSNTKDSKGQAESQTISKEPAPGLRVEVK